MALGMQVDSGHSVVRPRILGVLLDGPLVRCQGFGDHLPRGVRIAEPDMQVGLIGIEVRGSLERREGEGALTGGTEAIARPLRTRSPR